MEKRFNPSEFDKFSKETDWFGLWYQIMRERGDNDEPTFGKLNLKNHRIDWFRFSHQYMDGVGVLNYLYNKENIKFLKTPNLKENCSPKILEYLIAFYKFFLKPKVDHVQWKFFNKDIQTTDYDIYDLSYKLLSIEQTKKLKDFAKSKNVSLCAFLLHLSSKVFLEQLSINNKGLWTLPVNLRPVLKRENPYSNHSSGVLIPVDLNQDNSKTINQKIKVSLKNKEHWCVWQLHQIGKIIGYKGMQKISLKSSRKNFFIGSFSYFGEWDLPSDETWIGGPPGSKNFPISVMVIIAQNQLCYSLKIHPSILRENINKEVILSDIFKEIQKCLE